MLARIAPLPAILILAVIGLLLTAAAVSVAIRQPWLGLELSTAPGSTEIAIDAVTANGPTASVVAPSTLLSLGRGSGPVIAPSADDLIEEPDALETYEEMRALFEGQSILVGIISQGQVQIAFRDADGTVRRALVAPRPFRPISDLPSAFWVQILVGFASFLVGIWVWSVRPKDISTRLFGLVGLSILAFTYSAAIYSTRELAIDGALFRVLSAINHGGALAFGAAMIVLLLSYPRRLVAARYLVIPPIIFGAWWLADTLRLLSGPPLGSHLPTMLEMVGIVLAAIIQYWRARNDPGARAIVRWFGLSVTAGAGAFVLMVIAPSMAGIEPVLQQGYAFVFFLAIHVGIAIGVARYRLFDLDRWAFRILFYMSGAVLLIIVDVALISWVAIERAPAFGLSLALIALLYLPLRDTIANRFLGSSNMDREECFQDMVEVALCHSEKDQQRRWQALLKRVFQPLRIFPGGNVMAPILMNEGTVLALPAIGSLPPQRLEYAMQGRCLFSPREQARASELCAMLSHAMESRVAYERGVVEERSRIKRDMHDNIGVQLLGALHSRDLSRKDDLIRDTLVDLREIINNSSSQRLTLAEVMADLRVEMADLLTSAGLALTWDMEITDDLPAQAIPVVRSILREAIGNVLRHAQASTVGVSLNRENGCVVLTIEDDGSGFASESVVKGNGLENMRSRMASLKGVFIIAAAAPGTRITARFPMEPQS